MTRSWAQRKPPCHPEGEWLRISHEMTLEADEMADRDDMIVKIAPDAGYDDQAFDSKGQLKKDKDGKPVAHQHPGVTFLDKGIIEINAKHFPEDFPLEECHPTYRPNRDNYPVVWGILGHEAAHAHFSKWMFNLSGQKLTAEEAPGYGAAILLEESRIEAKQMDFRPQDQRWLEAMATKFASDEVRNELIKSAKQQGKDMVSVELSKIALSRACALLLARIDSGSVEPNDATDIVEDMAIKTFGKKTYSELRDIWCEAQMTADDDHVTMLRLGKRWYEITGDSGDQSFSVEVTSGDGDSDSGDNDLAKAMADAARRAYREASGQADDERLRKRINEGVNKARSEAKSRQEAEKRASGLMAGKGNDYRHPVHGYRDPTPKELSLARWLRRALQAAYVPERAKTRVTRVLPPGRLSMRAVQQMDAQLKAGMFPDIEPFTHIDRRHVITPPLKVGIIQDVSGSQGSAAAAAVSGAWSLAKATTMLVDAQVAMVSFGNAVHMIINPQQRVPKVPMITANAGTDHFCDSLSALEGLLDLTRPGTARLVVILTDGCFNSSYDMNNRDPALKRLADQGVHFLWLDTDGGGSYVPKRMHGVHVISNEGDYDGIPRIIAQEAVKALQK